MGIRTSNTCDVVLEDCRIPAANLVGEEGRGFSIAMKTLDQARAWMGCVATGIAQRGINEGIAYAKERVQFGKPVIKNQAMQFKVADMENQNRNSSSDGCTCFNKDGYGITTFQRSSDRKMLCI